MLQYDFICRRPKWNIYMYVIVWFILCYRLLIIETAFTDKNSIENRGSNIIEGKKVHKTKPSKFHIRNHLNYRHTPYEVISEEKSNKFYDHTTNHIHDNNMLKFDRKVSCSKENEKMQKTKEEPGEVSPFPFIILLSNSNNSNQTINIGSSTINGSASMNNAHYKGDGRTFNERGEYNLIDTNEHRIDPYHPFLDHAYHINKGRSTLSHLLLHSSEPHTFNKEYSEESEEDQEECRNDLRLITNCIKNPMMKAIEKIVIITKIDRTYNAYRIQKYFLDILLRVKTGNCKNYHGSFRNTLQILKKMYNFMISNQLRFRKLEECKTSIDLLDSFDLVKMLLVSMFLFDKDIFKKKKEELLFSVSKNRKIVREYLTSRNGFYRYIYDSPHVTSRLLFKEVSEHFRTLHDFGKKILLLGRERDPLNSNEVYLNFYNIRVCLCTLKSTFLLFQNSLSDLIHNRNSLFISQYANLKENLKSLLDNLLHNLISQREYIRESLKKKCKEETIIKVLYFNIGSIIIKRLLVDSQDIREVSIIMDCFYNLINICDKFLTAYQLLKLSENKKDSDPMDSEEADDLLRFALHSVYLKILYISFFEIREKVFFMFIVLDQYMDGQIEKDSMKQCFTKSHEIENLCDLVLYFLTSVLKYAKRIKHTELIFEMGSILNMRIANIDTIKISIQNNVQTDEYVKIGKYLIKKIYETYENMNKLLEDTI